MCLDKPRRAATFSVSRWQRLPGHGPTDDQQGKTTIPQAKKAMTARQQPKIDSIRKLAKFWDTHDLTDFQDELEEVTEPIFVRGTRIAVQLQSSEAKTLETIARSKGVSRNELVRQWVLQRLVRPKKIRLTT
jgi:hypothetical protein